MLRLNCFIKVRADRRETVLDAARKLTAVSLTQAGCVAYDIFESATRPDVLMICETWRDEAALKAHSDSPEFAEYVSIMRSNAEMKLETFSF